MASRKHIDCSLDTLRLKGQVAGVSLDHSEKQYIAGNDDIPMIDNKYIDYEYPMTFDSPYMQSKCKSGKVKLRFGSEELNLDFLEQLTPQPKQ